MVSPIMLFNRWSSEGIKIEDAGLAEYVNIRPIVVPISGGRHTGGTFWKRKVNVVERLVNKLGVTGHTSLSRKHVFTSGRNTGKKQKLMKAVKEAFNLIEQRTKSNPIQVFVQAVEKAAPRGEITTVEYGGVRRPVAVDVSPQRRVDIALALIAKGTMQKTHSSKKHIHECLADEIMLAAKGDMKSYAIEKKENLERQAESSH